MYRPDTQASGHARARLRELYRAQTGKESPEPLLYGYFLRMGLIKQRVYRYLLTFSVEDQILTILRLPGRSGKEKGAAYVISFSEIEFIRYSIRHRLMIRSGALPQAVRMYVPPYIATTMEAAGILPLCQQEEAAQLREMVRWVRRNMNGNPKD